MSAKFYALGASQAWLDQRDDELRAAADGYVDDVPQNIVLPSVTDSPAYKALLRTIELLREQNAALVEENRQLKSSAPAKEKKPRDTNPDKPRRRKPAEVQHTPEGDYYPTKLVAEMKGMNQSNISRQRYKLGINVKYFGGVQHIHADDLKKIEKSEKAKRKR